MKILVVDDSPLFAEMMSAILDDDPALHVVGVASGEAYGNALNWRYDMDLKVGDGTMRVHFNDWMFLQPSGVLLNRARVTKLGFAVGEVTLAFFRPETAGAMTSEFLSEPTVAALAMKAATR